MHHFGANCLKASNDKVKQLYRDFKRKKMSITVKNGHLEVSFSSLCTGEFRHKTYARAQQDSLYSYKDS